jgi:hypothetical protein
VIAARKATLKLRLVATVWAEFGPDQPFLGNAKKDRFGPEKGPQRSAGIKKLVSESSQVIQEWRLGPV